MDGLEGARLDLGPNGETPRVHATELRIFWRCSERRFACARRDCPYPRSSFVTCDTVTLVGVLNRYHNDQEDTLLRQLAPTRDTPGVCLGWPFLNPSAHALPYTSVRNTRISASPEAEAPVRHSQLQLAAAQAHAHWRALETESIS